MTSPVRAQAADAGVGRIGLSTYAFFWQWHSTSRRPLDLFGMIDKTADWGVGLLQICDYPLLETLDAAGLAELKRHADSRDVGLELGTRGVSPDHLGRFLQIAEALDVTLVRSMFNTADHRPTAQEASGLLAESLPAYEAAGVVIALETYEQVPTATIVQVVADAGSPALGICLDPANSVAALEHPRATIDATAPYVRNLHVKDFSVTRKDGWVGFTLAGCPLGEGLLDYHYMIDTVRPHERGVSSIIEHWLPWQGDSETTCALEDRWTLSNLLYLRS
jgi:sugar phosphate isomerase/epimerase